MSAQPRTRETPKGWVCTSQKTHDGMVIHVTGVGRTAEEARRHWAAVADDTPLFIQDLPATHRKAIVELYTEHYSLGFKH